MTLKILTILLFTALLFSCPAQAGPRENHYKPHHGAYHHKPQRHRHHKHNCKKRDYRFQAHDRRAAYAPAYIVAGRELGLRYGFPAGEAVIIYRIPYGY